MKKMMLSLIGMLMLGSALWAQTFVSTNSQIEFFSKTPVEDIYAINKYTNCILKLETGDMAVIVNIQSFDFEKELMKDHFNEKYMESEKYPRSTFEGKMTNLDGTRCTFSQGEQEVKVSGKLSIHGVTREVEAVGKINVTDSGISATSKFQVALKDYNIEVPKIVLKNIAEIIDVTVNLNFKPKN